MTGFRVLLASVLASCVLLLVVVSGLLVGALAAGVPAGEAFQGSVGHLGFFVFFFGFPVCVALTSALGCGLVRLERARSQPLPWTGRYLLPSTLSGVAFPVIWWRFWGKPFAPVAWAVAGVVGGLLAALVFWRVAGPRQDSRMHQSKD